MKIRYETFGPAVRDAAKEGDNVVVRCTSKSEDAAELFVGKKSFGRAKKVNGIFEWKVPFQFDKLNVILL